jgi:hypothetical protein
MGGSGTSGMLRFKNGAGEQFLVLGIHNWGKWCDTVTDLGKGEHGQKILSEYYSETPKRIGSRRRARSELQ